MNVRFRVDGEERCVEVEGLVSLAEVLHRQSQVFHRGGPCPDADCGTCALLVDGKVVTSCTIPMAHVEGSEVITVDGLGETGRLLRASAEGAFGRQGASPCPDCFLPSLLIVAAMLKTCEAGPPDADDIRDGLAGLGCRCGIHAQKVDILVEAARTTCAAERS